MEIPSKTLSHGFSLPVFGFGTWGQGGRFTKDEHSNDDVEVTAIKKAIAEGVTHIDTAELYAKGHTETLVSRAIAGVDRSALFIASKVLPAHCWHDSLIEACKGSLRRLGTDYLDLYLIHAPNPEIPLSETMAAMDELVEQGLVRNIGVSNFALERLQQAQDCAKHPIVTNQVHYNLATREPEVSGLLDYCQRNDVLLTAWRPVEKGLLTTHDQTALGGMAEAGRSKEKRTAAFAAGGRHDAAAEALAQADLSLMAELCERYQATPAQIAIAWLIAQPNVVTIAKMTNPSHLYENLGALEVTLSTEDAERLRSEYPVQLERSPVVPLR